MKKISIQIIIDDGKIGYLVRKEGLSSSKIEDVLETIGILENLKQKELKKIDTMISRTRTNEENE